MPRQPSSVPENLRNIFYNTDDIPVIWKKIDSAKLIVRLPYDRNGGSNRDWLRNQRRLTIEWNKEDGYWLTPKAWLSDTIDRCLARRGVTYVIQPYREQEICAAACWNAEGYICECSCLGKNHGMGRQGYRWYEISDTFAFRNGDETYAVRKLTKTDERPIVIVEPAEEIEVEPELDYEDIPF